MKLLKSDIWRS